MIIQVSSSTDLFRPYSIWIWVQLYCIFLFFLPGSWQKLKNPSDELTDTNTSSTPVKPSIILESTWSRNNTSKPIRFFIVVWNFIRWMWIEYGSSSPEVNFQSSIVPMILIHTETYRCNLWLLSSNWTGPPYLVHLVWISEISNSRHVGHIFTRSWILLELSVFWRDVRHLHENQLLLCFQRAVRIWMREW